MNTTEKGLSFEKRIMAKVQQALETGLFSVSGNHWEIFHQKQYYSERLKANIRVDVSVEFRRAEDTPPSFYIFIECKDYSGLVPVNDVEEFYAKTQQIAGVNAKAMLFTRYDLQEGALRLAQSYGMAVVRLMDEDDLQQMVERINQNLTTSISNSIYINVYSALSNELFVSTRRDTFALYEDLASYDLVTIFSTWAKELESV